MKHFLLSLSLLLAGLLPAAHAQTLFFALETAKDSTRVALTIDGNTVTGTKSWQPKGDAHGASGTLQGSIRDGIIRAVYEYIIEGSDQSQQEVFKLDGDRLLIGRGELVDREGNGKLTLKDPRNVEFLTVLKRIEVAEPKPGSPERKAIMDAMRAPVSGRVGKPVIFTGNVRVSGAWARFQGNVTTADGKPPKNQDAASDLELDFFALLRKDADGVWEVQKWGFAGDIGVRDEAREKFPKAPWVLFE